MSITITFTEEQMAALKNVLNYLAVDCEEAKGYYQTDKEDRSEEHIYLDVLKVGKLIDKKDWEGFDALQKEIFDDEDEHDPDCEEEDCKECRRGEYCDCCDNECPYCSRK